MEKQTLIFDDVIFDLQKFGGVSEYWRRTTASSYFSSRYVVLRMGRDNSSYWLPDKVRSFTLQHQKCSIPNIQNSVFHSSYYRLPTSNTAKSVVTVHDFIYEKYGKGLRAKLHHQLKRKAVLAADCVICISHATKADLMELIPEVEPSKIEVIYHGVDHDLFACEHPTDNSRELHNILFVGSRNGYKQFGLAVQSVSLIKSKKLTFVGSPPSNAERELLDKMLLGRWQWLGQSTNEQLAKIYHESFCLVYPSDYEGFGMPLLEAMAAGCPVVTSNADALREVGGGASTIAGTQEASSYQNAFELIENDRSSLVSAGLRWSAQFNWQRTTDAMSQIYQHVL